MNLILTETRDWLGFALSVVTGYAWWRERRSRSKDVTIQVPVATARAMMSTPAILNLSPANGTSSASMTLTTGNDASTQAVLDQMAEIFPYEFPPN